MTSVTQKPGKVCVLRDVLKEWGLDEEYWARMSGKWRCVVAGYAGTEEECMRNLAEEKPSMLSAANMEDVHAAVGPDGIDWVTAPGRNELPRHRLAFNSSWGKPGADLIHESHLTPVKKFTDIFDHEDPTPRNLQMFHRQTPDEPRIPVLPSLLNWPEFMDHLSIPVDKATRLSQKNALTTWHLDDCGEFVYQAALPVRPEKLEKQRVLTGPGGKPVVKIFFSVSKSGYDYITQDQEQNRSGRFCQVSLWDTPDGHLPEVDDLPLVTLSLIEAGGRPLLLYPNIPHTVLTVHDSILIEERRLHALYLDEIVYFHFRSRQSVSPPICYSFLSDTCALPASVKAELVTPLLSCIASHLPQASADLKKQPKNKPLPSFGSRALFTVRRGLTSLRALLVEDVFALDPSTRAEVESFLKEHSASFSVPDAMGALTEQVLGTIKAQRHGIIQHHAAPVYYIAYAHAQGHVVFGPKRVRLQQAVADRKALVKCEFMDRHSNEIQDLLDSLPPTVTDGQTSVAAVPIDDKERQALLDDLF
ncbi:hypothetical protein DIPPA_14874 [Diplonema papillatum]|nr:hypothetical protein DIPPA_14874 [Diplonema papillatum]|eukprot:gene9036-13989_t